MQILHPFVGPIQQYLDELSDADRYRPDHCPQCKAKRPLTSHGFYRRTLVDPGFDGVIRVRRYLCNLCKRTVSLLPPFALPWLRFSLTVISLFLVARLLQRLTLAAAALAASQRAMPYQRGQFWIRRFRKQAPKLTLSLAPLVASARAHSPCWNPSAGSPLTASCSLSCALTCWAGRSFSLPRGGAPCWLPPTWPAEGPHIAFVWIRHSRPL